MNMHVQTSMDFPATFALLMMTEQVQPWSK
jgi:hypothetical protein